MAILTLPKEKLMICMAIVCMTYIFTLLISCGAYLAILIQKQRKFNNRIISQNEPRIRFKKVAAQPLAGAIKMDPITTVNCHPDPGSTPRKCKKWANPGPWC